MGKWELRAPTPARHPLSFASLARVNHQWGTDAWVWRLRPRDHWPGCNTDHVPGGSSGAALANREYRRRSSAEVPISLAVPVRVSGRSPVPRVVRAQGFEACPGHVPGACAGQWSRAAATSPPLAPPTRGSWALRDAGVPRRLTVGRKALARSEPGPRDPGVSTPRREPTSRVGVAGDPYGLCRPTCFWSSRLLVKLRRRC